MGTRINDELTGGFRINSEIVGGTRINGELTSGMVTPPAGITPAFRATILSTGLEGQAGGNTIYRRGTVGSITSGDLEYAAGMDIDRIVFRESSWLFNDFTSGNTWQAVMRQLIADGNLFYFKTPYGTMSDTPTELSSGDGGWFNVTFANAPILRNLGAQIVTGDEVEVAMAQPGYTFP